MRLVYYYTGPNNRCALDQTFEQHNGELEKQLPTDRKICFAVSISGPGIEKFAFIQCLPEFSITAGFVELENLIDVLVPKGDGRRIELFIFF